MNRKPLLLVFTVLLVTACSEQKEHENVSAEPSQNIEQELGDEQLTQELSQKLLSATKVIGLEQELSQEELNKENLEKLSEEDRQALIDLTIDKSAEKIKEDADKVIDGLEKNTRENASNR